MNTIDDVLKACQFVKQAGTSSKVPVPIIVLERLCREAKLWADAPDVFKDAIKQAGAK
jgi:uncharacterized protein HemY